MAKKIREYVGGEGKPSHITKALQTDVAPTLSKMIRHAPDDHRFMRLPQSIKFEMEIFGLATEESLMVRYGNLIWAEPIETFVERELTSLNTLAQEIYDGWVEINQNEVPCGRCEVNAKIEGDYLCEQCRYGKV